MDNEIKEYIDFQINQLSINVQNRFVLLDQKVDQLEKINAALTTSYAELAVIVESLSSIIINQNEDQKKEFFDTLALARKKMMDTFQHGINLAEQNIDKFTAYNPVSDEGSDSSSS